jgi:hypothetical protein
VEGSDSKTSIKALCRVCKMSWNRGDRPSTWDEDYHWILNEIVAFFKTAYKYDLEMSKFALTESYATRGTSNQYAVLDLSGNIRSTAHPETVNLVVCTITTELTFCLIFEDVNKRSRYRHWDEIPTDPALRSTWLQGIMGTFFDPSADGRAILEKYDEEVARQAELQRQKDQATNEMKAVMVKHMKTCWNSIVAETRSIQHVDALSEFNIQEEMKTITILVMNSTSVHPPKDRDPSGHTEAMMDDGPPTKVAKLESHLGDLMERCKRLGL